MEIITKYNIGFFPTYGRSFFTSLTHELAALSYLEQYEKYPDGIFSSCISFVGTTN